MPDILRHFHNFVQIPDIIRRLEMTFENSRQFPIIPDCVRTLYELPQRGINKENITFTVKPVNNNPGKLGRHHVK
jgi:hypothetical protein